MYIPTISSADCTIGLIAAKIPTGNTAQIVNHIMVLICLDVDYHLYVCLGEVMRTNLQWCETDLIVYKPWRGAEGGQSRAAQSVTGKSGSVIMVGTINFFRAPASAMEGCHSIPTFPAHYTCPTRVGTSKSNCVIGQSWPNSFPASQNYRRSCAARSDKPILVDKRDSSNKWMKSVNVIGLSTWFVPHCHFFLSSLLCNYNLTNCDHSVQCIRHGR
jgi:hypothetical protein